jgi:hypothetical protein
MTAPLRARILPFLAAFAFYSAIVLVLRSRLSARSRRMRPPTLETRSSRRGSSGGTRPRALTNDWWNAPIFYPERRTGVLETFLGWHLDDAHQWLSGSPVLA